jgi:hypothetical protein
MLMSVRRYFHKNLLDPIIIKVYECLVKISNCDTPHYASSSQVLVLGTHTGITYISHIELVRN